MTMEVPDHRKGDRFLFTDPPPGTFGAADVTVVDVGLAGAQIQHTQALRIGTIARLAFREGDTSVSTQGRVIWSHFLQTPAGLVYRSGIRIQPDTSFAAAVNAFYKTGAARRDTDSLERKRQRMIDREKQRESGKSAIIRNVGGGAT
jgi:hypothetical protein